MAKGGKDVEIVLELENLAAFSDFLMNKNGLIGGHFKQFDSIPHVTKPKFTVRCLQFVKSTKNGLDSASS